MARRHLVCIVRLSTVKAADKLAPLLLADTQVTLIRHAPIPSQQPNLEQVIHQVGLGDDEHHQTLWARLRNFWACFWSGIRQTRQQKPDAVVGIYIVYGFIAWFVAKLTRYPIIISLLGGDVNRDIDIPIYGHWIRFVLRHTDIITVFGEEARQKLIRYHIAPDRIVVLPNTANTHTFYHDATVDAPYDLIFVGYLRTPKRVDLVLDALHLVCQKRPATNLLIVGEGEERAHLEQQARDLGISDNVTFYGHADPSEIPALIRQAKIFILMSIFEGLPMSMVEAMCCGLPAIAANVGAIGEVIIDGENGYLLDTPPNPQRASDCILNILGDSERYAHLQRGAIAVKDRYGYESGAAVWQQILDRLPHKS